MRLASSRKFLYLSGLSVGFIFVWTWIADPHVSDIQIETFSIRKSLSLVTVQARTHKVSEKRHQWGSPTVTWGESNIPEQTSDQVKAEGNLQTPTTSKEEALPHGGIVKAQRNSTTRKKRQTRLILMSYIRAGTTFTGDLFQFSPDVMYFYEPLLYTHDVDNLPKGLPVRNRLIGQFFTHPNPPETQALLESLLRCDLTSANMEFVLALSYSQSFKEYVRCTNYPQKNNIARCIADLVQRCHDSPNVVSKVLRLKMWEVEELLSRDPELRVVHLVRDPRGIVLSRRLASYYLQLDTLCNRIASDAELSLKLQNVYPGRILTLRYEDLATHPTTITKRLYDFAGIDWTEDIAGRVQNITSPKDVQFKEKIFGTQRRNSTATAFNWRLKLDFPSAQNAQTLCGKMMTIYGYKRLKTEMELRDLRLPSMEEKYDDKFLKAEANPSQLKNS